MLYSSGTTDFSVQLLKKEGAILPTKQTLTKYAYLPKRIHHTKFLEKHEKNHVFCIFWVSYLSMFWITKKTTTKY